MIRTMFGFSADDALFPGLTQPEILNTRTKREVNKNDSLLKQVLVNEGFVAFLVMVAMIAPDKLNHNTL